MLTNRVLIILRRLPQPFRYVNIDITKLLMDISFKSNNELNVKTMWKKREILDPSNSNLNPADFF
jgi:hypothetical protein